MPLLQRAVTFRFTFREMTLRLRSILFCGGLLLAVNTSFGQGEYQQTKDGKTFVWNGTPKPGDTATWAGDRDKENYASGFGALTWYTAKGTVYGLYYGNMVHGKLEGPVNVHTNGRTAHAYFADGERVTGWARGPAPSKMNVPEEARLKSEASKKTASSSGESTPETAKKPKTEPEKIRPIATKPAAAPTEPTPPRIAEKKSEPRPAENELPRSTPPGARTESDASAFEPTPIPKAEGFSQPSIQEAPPVAEASATERKTDIPSPTSETSHQPSAAKSATDVSLSTLAGPPSSLRTTPDTSPPKMESETSSSRESAPLTETEAISLADTEASAQGYQLDNYQRPKVDHSAVKGKWSLFYGLKEGESGSAFTITVEDKTRKVEIRK